MRAVIALQKAAGNKAVAGLLAGNGAGGGGGAGKPSTLAAGAGALAHGRAAAQSRAGGGGSALVAAGPPPAGLPVGAEPAIAERPAPALPAPGAEPPTPVAGGDAVATGPTTAGFAAHERAGADAITAASAESAGHAEALKPGPIAAPVALAAVPGAAPAGGMALVRPDVSGVPVLEAGAVRGV